MSSATGVSVFGMLLFTHGPLTPERVMVFFSSVLAPLVLALLTLRRLGPLEKHQSVIMTSALGSFVTLAWITVSFIWH
jgi:ABC-type Co2+ transport system permease subunit